MTMASSIYNQKKEKSLEVWNTCVLDEKKPKKPQTTTTDDSSNDDWWWGTLAFFTLVVWGYLYRVLSK